jgi:hypothetical protein
MKTALLELIAAARNVEANWSRGDLAAAVNELRQAADLAELELREPAPVQSEGRKAGTESAPLGERQFKDNAEELCDELEQWVSQCVRTTGDTSETCQQTCILNHLLKVRHVINGTTEADLVS